MNCPAMSDWDLLAVGALDDERAATLREHARTCAACGVHFESARRAHGERVRMYEAVDRGHEELREQLLAALPAAPGRSAWDGWVRGWGRAGDTVMTTIRKTPAKVGALVLVPAACIALVLLLTVSFGERSAFAAALQRLRSAQTIVCNVHATVPAMLPGMAAGTQMDGQLYMSDAHGSRYDMTVNGTVMTQQFLALDGQMTSVNPLMRNYTVIDISAAQTGEFSAGSTPGGFLRMFRKLQDSAHRDLGEREISGVRAQGFEIDEKGLGFDQPGARSELWVDAEKLLPVQLVMQLPSPMGSGTLTMVYDEFEWNVPLEAAFFEPQIPADYERIDATMPKPDEKSLVGALQKFADLLGHYPTGLDMMTATGELAGGLAGKFARAGQAPDQKAIMQESISIGAGLAYYMQLVRDGVEVEYFGEDVTPDDTDAVLLRWKLPTGEWRVVYGDLRVGTLAP